MILRPTLTIEQRRALKPVVGDVVLFEGVEYVVDQIGSRWAYIHRVDDPKKFPKMAPITSILKKPGGQK
jgi:hypothetical protein